MKITLPLINGVIYGVPNPVVDPAFTPQCYVNFFPAEDFKSVEKHHNDDRHKFLFVGHPTHAGVYTNKKMARVGGYDCVGNTSSTHSQVQDVANAIYEWCQRTHKHPSGCPFPHLKGAFAVPSKSVTSYITYVDSPTNVSSSSTKKRRRQGKKRPGCESISSEDDDDDAGVREKRQRRATGTSEAVSHGGPHGLDSYDDDDEGSNKRKRRPTSRAEEYYGDYEDGDGEKYRDNDDDYEDGDDGKYRDSDDDDCEDSDDVDSGDESDDGRAQKRCKVERRTGDKWKPHGPCPAANGPVAAASGPVAAASAAVFPKPESPSALAV